MFKSKPALTKMVDALYRACEPLGRGDYISHDQIIKILKVQPHEEHWGHCIKKLKDRLREDREITLLSERGHGYKLLPVQEQLMLVPRMCTQYAERWVEKGVRNVEVLSTASLSDHQRKLKNAQLEGMRLSQERLVSHMQIQASLDKPIERRHRSA